MRQCYTVSGGVIIIISFPSSLNSGANGKAMDILYFLY